MDRMVLDCLVLLGLISAAISGSFLVLFFMERGEENKRRELIRNCAGSLTQQEVSQVLLESKGITLRIILFTLSCSQSPDRSWLNKTSSIFWGFALKDYGNVVRKAGLVDAITKEGIILARMKLSLALSLSAGLFGFCFSEFLGFLLLCLGFIAGYSLVMKSLRMEMTERVYVAEKQLSEMLEIVVLGLKSGLSFDRSVQFYCDQFSGSLSRLMGSSLHQWKYGLISRNEGLRIVADSYDSPLFKRTFESVVRSLRFGTSLSESLHICSSEARAIRKSKLEERVAKAPVKMLLPVGMLILPAMLMLIVGPILLDLVNGF